MSEPTSFKQSDLSWISSVNANLTKLSTEVTTKQAEFDSSQTITYIFTTIIGGLIAGGGIYLMVTSGGVTTKAFLKGALITGSSSIASSVIILWTKYQCPKTLTETQKSYVASQAKALTSDEILDLLRKEQTLNLKGMTQEQFNALILALNTKMDSNQENDKLIIQEIVTNCLDKLNAVPNLSNLSDVLRRQLLDKMDAKVDVTKYKNLIALFPANPKELGSFQTAWQGLIKKHQNILFECFLNNENYQIIDIAGFVVSDNDAHNSHAGGRLGSMLEKLQPQEFQKLTNLVSQAVDGKTNDQLKVLPNPTRMMLAMSYCESQLNQLNCNSLSEHFLLLTLTKITKIDLDKYPAMTNLFLSKKTNQYWKTVYDKHQNVLHKLISENLGNHQSLYHLLLVKDQKDLNALALKLKIENFKVVLSDVSTAFPNSSEKYSGVIKSLSYAGKQLSELPTQFLNTLNKDVLYSLLKNIDSKNSNEYSNFIVNYLQLSTITKEEISFIVKNHEAVLIQFLKENKTPSLSGAIQKIIVNNLDESAKLDYLNKCAVGQVGIELTFRMSSNTTVTPPSQTTTVTASTTATSSPMKKSSSTTNLNRAPLTTQNLQTTQPQVLKSNAPNPSLHRRASFSNTTPKTPSKDNSTTYDGRPLPEAFGYTYI